MHTKITFTFGGNCREKGFIRTMKFRSNNVGAAYKMAELKLENPRLIGYGG